MAESGEDRRWITAAKTGISDTPKAGASGIPFARGRLGQRAEVLLVHAAPPVLTTTVRASGRVLAEGVDLEVTGETPIARLTRRGERIEREDIWPDDADIARLVLLPGGEAGMLIRWWHAEDRSEWRWQLEFYNQRSAAAASALSTNVRSTPMNIPLRLWLIHWSASAARQLFLALPKTS